MTSGLGSFDNSLSTSASGKLFTNSVLDDSWMVCGCWSNSYTNKYTNKTLNTASYFSLNFKKITHWSSHQSTHLHSTSLNMALYYQSLWWKIANMYVSYQCDSIAHEFHHAQILPVSEILQTSVVNRSTVPTLYPNDFSSLCVHGNRSRYLYRSMTNAVSFPSASCKTDHNYFVSLNANSYDQ